MYSEFLQFEALEYISEVYEIFPLTLKYILLQKKILSLVLFSLIIKKILNVFNFIHSAQNTNL